MQFKSSSRKTGFLTCSSTAHRARARHPPLKHVPLSSTALNTNPWCWRWPSFFSSFRLSYLSSYTFFRSFFLSFSTFSSFSLPFLSISICFPLSLSVSLYLTLSLSLYTGLGYIYIHLCNVYKRLMFILINTMLITIIYLYYFYV